MLLLYRLLLSLAAPALAVAGLIRLARGRESRAALAERLGGGDGHGDGTIWIHGASNGELTSARRLVEALAQSFPDRPLLVTCNTATARDLALGWAIPRLAVRQAPVDLRWVLARFLRRWRPAVLVVLENELWPNRLLACRRQGIPVAVVAARISARSASRWGRLGSLTAKVLGAVDHLSAQDAASAQRFAALGLDPARQGPVAVLKSGVALAPPPADALARLGAVFLRADTLLAASTHPGEEAGVLEAVRRARPALKLILAPRHPRRGAEVAEAVRAAGLTLAVRSRGEPPGPETQVYLADTIGEMALWYALAGTTFVGGSWADVGGHTPFEPAQAGSAILHGPKVANFSEAYAALDAAGAALEVADSEALAAALARLADPAEQAAFAARARDVLAEADGDAALGQTVATVVRLVAPDSDPVLSAQAAERSVSRGSR